MSQNKRKPKSADYRVGYGRPPVQHQFRRGQAARHRRTGGRTERARTRGMLEVLTEPVRVKVDGEEKVLPFPVALMQLIMSKGLQGEIASAKILLELVKDTNAMAPDDVIRIEITPTDALL